MADVEAVDGLHQTADGFLEQIGIAQGVMAEALGDVGGQANVGRGQAMFEVNVAVVEAANRHDAAGFIIAVVADELSHGPRLQRAGDAGGGGRSCGSSTRTNSLLVSQKSASNSRSSSGVSRSEEKIVVGATGVGSSVTTTGWRFRRRVFMAVFPYI